MIRFDALKYAYPSRRSVVYGAKGMVATANPLAAQAGLDILKRGGNAIDAAVAAAMTLSVVEPTSNGIGSDAFALVLHGGKLHGLNASGPSPASLSAQLLLDRGHTKMPHNGVTSLTVPGAPSAWAALARRFGQLGLTELVKPAASYAEEGFVLQPTVGNDWAHAYRRFQKALEAHPELAPWFETFAPQGRCPKIGEKLRLEHHAHTLRQIAASDAESFYRGELAQKIAAFVRQHGGFLSEEDLAAYSPAWVEPISVPYKGYEVYEIPPNGQGMTVLMALNILHAFPEVSTESFEGLHRQIEALKLAFADVQAYVTDPSAMSVSVDALLSERYAAERRKLIGDTASHPTAGNPSESDTVYLCTADGEGNMVSYIQSNYMGFGSGVVIPHTGISLQNRGCNFSLDLTSDNVLAPSKRPYHTIIPGFLFKGGKPVGPFGVMGGFMQPQGHLQVLLNTIDHGMNPQEALDRPRWCWTGGKTIEVEQAFSNHMANLLLRAGHDIVVKANSTSFGRGAIIWRDESGVLCGGVDMRADGMVAVW